jgi:hypothetical protein
MHENNCKLKIESLDYPAKSKLFFQLPYIIYKNDPNWVAPLLIEQKRLLHPKKNPFFKKAKMRAWLVSNNRTPLGRIIAFTNPTFNAYHQEVVGFIGFFECINELDIAKSLFEKSTTWLKAQGVKKIMGPINLDTSNECGVLIKGFEHPPIIMMNHTPKYYESLFLKCGFEKEHDLFAFKLSPIVLAKSPKIIAKMKRISDMILKREGIQFRKINMSDFKKEALRIASLYDELLADNWGFSPVTDEEFLYTANSLKSIVNPAIVSYLEKNGQVIGCSFSIPDINEVLIDLKGKLFPFGFIKFLRSKNKINKSRVVLLGVRKKFQFRGFAILMIYKTIIDTIQNGYQETELSWVSEKNINLIKIFNKLGADHYKTYRVFQKNI